MLGGGPAGDKVPEPTAAAEPPTAGRTQLRAGSASGAEAPGAPRHPAGAATREDGGEDGAEDGAPNFQPGLVTRPAAGASPRAPRRRNWGPPGARRRRRRSPLRGRGARRGSTPPALRTPHAARLPPCHPSPSLDELPSARGAKRAAPRRLHRQPHGHEPAHQRLPAPPRLPVEAAGPAPKPLNPLACVPARTLPNRRDLWLHGGPREGSSPTVGAPSSDPRCAFSYVESPGYSRFCPSWRQCPAGHGSPASPSCRQFAR